MSLVHGVRDVLGLHPANGILRTYVYDGAGHKIARYLNGSSTPDATWNYATGTGLLTQVAGADGFERIYSFDSSLRPVQVTTDIPGDAEWSPREFNEQFAYDGNFGRLKETQYPSGE